MSPGQMFGFRPFGSLRPLHKHVIGPSGRTGRASVNILPSAPHNVAIPELFASMSPPDPTSSWGQNLKFKVAYLAPDVF